MPLCVDCFITTSNYLSACHTFSHARATSAIVWTVAWAINISYTSAAFHLRIYLNNRRCYLVITICTYVKSRRRSEKKKSFPQQANYPWPSNLTGSIRRLRGPLLEYWIRQILVKPWDRNALSRHCHSAIQVLTFPQEAVTYSSTHWPDVESSFLDGLGLVYQINNSALYIILNISRSTSCVQVNTYQSGARSYTRTLMEVYAGEVIRKLRRLLYA